MEKNEHLDLDHHDYNDFNEDSNTNELYEPTKKKMKYEEGEVECALKSNLLQFKIGYITTSGNILLDNKNIKDDDYPYDDDNNTLLIGSHKKPFEISLLHFQTFEGGEVYLIEDNWTKIGLNKYYTINEIYNNFINGKYLIGSLKYYYKNNYKNGIIDDVSEFHDESNSEIRLHYTTSRHEIGNVAWRTITWDLFSEFVPK